MEDSKAGRRSAAPTPTPSEGRQQATTCQPSPWTTTPESLSIHVPPLAPISPHYHRHHRHRHQDDDGQGWDSEDDEEHDDDGENSIKRDHTREFPGIPPSFTALESQTSDTRSRSDSLSSVSCSNFTRRPLPTPSISPATSTPHHGHHGVGFSLGVGGGGGGEGGGGEGGFSMADEYGVTSDCGMSAISGAASVATGSTMKKRGGRGTGGGAERFHGAASFARCLHENLGEYTPLTVLPQEQDDANVMPLLRIYDIFTYFRHFFFPKDLP